MATFTLTAKYQSTRTGGFHIDKGDQFVIHINMAGITPINLFNNSRCRDQLIKQFKINGSQNTEHIKRWCILRQWSIYPWRIV